MKIRKRLSVIAVACCIVAGLGILPAASADTTGPAVASALWEVSSDTITLTDNVAVPDYMLYGEVLHDGSYVDITADSADDLLEDCRRPPARSRRSGEQTAYVQEYRGYLLLIGRRRAVLLSRRSSPRADRRRSGSSICGSPTRRIRITG